MSHVTRAAFDPLPLATRANIARQHQYLKLKRKYYLHLGGFGFLHLFTGMLFPYIFLLQSDVSEHGVSTFSGF
jgi:hypothetical protein